MTDDRDQGRPTNEPIDDSDEREGDWEPMVPETTVPASDVEETPDSEQAAEEQDRQSETGEESPS